MQTIVTYKELGNNGRLGNQLFQIAATVGFALKNDYKFLLPPSWKYRSNFSIFDSNYGDADPTIQYQEPNFHYTKIDLPNQYGQVINLYGYFQSYKYFEKFSDIIHNIFNLKTQDEDICFIHVRRGDYIGQAGYHTNLTLDYYREAIDYMLSNGITKFKIFSDDLDWCREHFFNYDNVSFSTNVNEIDDLTEMSNCRAAIIANSSFSWWGAYLSKSKLVVAPKNWFGPLYHYYNTEDIYLPEWKQI